MEKKQTDFHCGFVPIIGRPNVGKSTLINRLVGEKIAIVTPKPQTTWRRILGVKTLPGAQVIFVDTPGVHAAHTKLNQALFAAAKGALRDADVILHLVEAQDPFPEGERLVWRVLAEAKAPCILAVNKIDLGMGGEFLSDLPFPYKRVVQISALYGTGVELLLEAVIGLLPPGPPLYPEDALTDQTVRAMAEEIIREKIFLITRQEVPYSCAVAIEEFKERGDGLTYIRGVINVERESQKGILIGKGGGRLKQIGTRARMDIEQLLGAKVYLELYVRVQEDWTKKDHALREFGIT